MTARTVNVIRVDYELPNKPDFKWIANVAAYSDDEALNFLRKKLGNIKVISIERKSRLDAITDEVEQTILKPYIEDQQAQAETAKPAPEPKNIATQKPKKTTTPIKVKK